MATTVSGGARPNGAIVSTYVLDPWAVRLRPSLAMKTVNELAAWAVDPACARYAEGRNIVDDLATTSSPLHMATPAAPLKRDVCC
ncbi:MAG: hypothetical protein RQ839_05375 [Thermoproteus sp.]|nr:hypothetical protein [Thermoproteus sp.]MDT7881496.1 hypothetical protein [Thermoproteus sp.]